MIQPSRRCYQHDRDHHPDSAKILIWWIFTRILLRVFECHRNLECTKILRRFGYYRSPSLIVQLELSDQTLSHSESQAIWGVSLRPNQAPCETLCCLRFFKLTSAACRYTPLYACQFAARLARYKHNAETEGIYCD